MKTTATEWTGRVRSEHRKVPIAQDWDWEYTGVVFTCPDCGTEFTGFPPEVDNCPACGADLWSEEEA